MHFLSLKKGCIPFCKPTKLLPFPRKNESFFTLSRSRSRWLRPIIYEWSIQSPHGGQLPRTIYLGWLQPSRHHGFLWENHILLFFLPKICGEKTWNKNCRRHGGIRAHVVFLYYKCTCWQVACARVMFHFLLKIMLYTFT